MAQSYFPGQSGQSASTADQSTLNESAFKDSAFLSPTGEKHSKVEDVQGAYIEHKDR